MEKEFYEERQAFNTTLILLEMLGAATGQERLPLGSGNIKLL